MGYVIGNQACCEGMASLCTTAHVSSNKPLQKHCSSWKVKSVRCALSPPTWRQGRRTVSFSLVLSHLLLIHNRDAAQASLLDKYVKRSQFSHEWSDTVGFVVEMMAERNVVDSNVSERKKLDPLEVYVPAVILTEFQIKDLEKTLEDDEPQFAFCRSLLRSGPAASLRVNIRAVAQYASDSGNGQTAFNDVDECLRSLEELDSLLLNASRNDPEASVKSMKAKINSALIALDSLLQTVPSDVLSKGKVIADSYREPEDVETGSLDPELKHLESIL